MSLNAVLQIVQLAGFGLTTTLLVLHAYKLAKRLTSAQTALQTATESVATQAERIVRLEQVNEDTRKALVAIEANLSGETAARKRAEKQRDEFLLELAKGGDGKVAAARINEEIAALSGLGKKR